MHLEILNGSHPELLAAARHHSSKADRCLDTVAAVALVGYGSRIAVFAGSRIGDLGKQAAHCLTDLVWLLLILRRFSARLWVKIWIKLNLNFCKMRTFCCTS